MSAGLQAETAAFALTLRLFILQNVDNRDRFDLLWTGGDSLELQCICLARFSKFYWIRAHCLGGAPCPGRISKLSCTEALYSLWTTDVFFAHKIQYSNRWNYVLNISSETHNVAPLLNKFKESINSLNLFNNQFFLSSIKKKINPRVCERSIITGLNKQLRKTPERPNYHRLCAFSNGSSGCQRH